MKLVITYMWRSKDNPWQSIYSSAMLALGLTLRQSVLATTSLHDESSHHPKYEF